MDSGQRDEQGSYILFFYVFKIVVKASKVKLNPKKNYKSVRAFVYYCLHRCDMSSECGTSIKF